LYFYLLKELKEYHKRKAKVFEMPVLRKILGVTRIDRRRNVDTTKHWNDLMQTMIFLISYESDG